jgi:lysine 6-dehydrogenase
MYTYAVLGSGRQGTAAAYDMARWGDARRVILADYDIDVARRAVARINSMIGKSISEAVQVDVTDLVAVAQELKGVDAFLTATPYYHNLELTDVAIEVGAHMCDLGGHTGIARQQHERDAIAKAAGVCIVPNCGQVPGMGTSLVVYAISLLDEAIDVFMWDGGIPQKPQPPFNYLLTFHIAGLTNEYAETAVFIRDGKITEVEPMTELETVEFPEPIGNLEAFVTGGGTDTMPWTFEGKVRTLQNKTLRYPGHFAQLRAFYDLGLWDQRPVNVGGAEFVPRDLFHTLFEPKVTFPGENDMILLRVRAVGKKDGRGAEAIVELIDYFDDETGFTSMERTTGWSAAIVAEMMARGEIATGSGGVEVQVPAGRYVEELRKRSINVTESIIFT